MLLDVAYRSQLGEGANRAIRDCGPACLAMVINHVRATHLTTDDICDLIGISGNGAGAGIWQLQGVAATYGVDLKRRANLKSADLEEALIAFLQPAIALVRYQYLPHKFDITYTGGHYVLVVGITASDVVIHDPYWPDARGANQRVPYAAFERAWQADGRDFRVSGQALFVVD